VSDHRRTVPLHDRYGAYGRYTWEGEGGGGGSWLSVGFNGLGCLHLIATD